MIGDLEDEIIPKIQSITFGDKNTAEDWKLLPTERPVFAPPKPKTTYIDIPGGNGALDLSESLTKYPIYENRTGSFTFRVLNGYELWYNRYSEIMNYLHGRRLEAILEDEPDYKYIGRFEVGGWNSGDTWSEISINYTVEPYKKYKIDSLNDEWIWDTFNFYTGVILSTKFKDIEIDTQTDPDSPEYQDNVFDGDLFGIEPLSPIFIVSDTGDPFEAEQYSSEKTYAIGDVVKRENFLYVCSVQIPEPEEWNNSKWRQMSPKGMLLHYENSYLGINETVYLVPGENKIPEIVVYGLNEYNFQFKGKGSVSILFTTGRL